MMVSSDQVKVTEEEIRIHFKCSLQLRDGIVVAPRKTQELPDVSTNDQRQRVEFLSVSNFRQRRVHLPGRCQVDGVPLVSRCISGVQVNGTQEFLLCGSEIPVVMHEHKCQRCMSLSKCRVERQGFTSTGPRIVHSLASWNRCAPERA